MTQLFCNPRLDHIWRFGAVCPACGDHPQQQIMGYFVAPAEWRCRLCKTHYTHEPVGCPTPDEASRQMEILFDGRAGGYR
jgi:hypothetical protein